MRISLATLAITLLVPYSSASMQVQATTRVSVDFTGAEVLFGGSSAPPALSDDGSIFVFESWDSTLVPTDTNGSVDTFAHDRILGTTELISIASDGTQANSDGITSDISADGRFVVFTSNATNLVPNDLNGFSDVFIRDRLLGTTECISTNTFGVPSNGGGGQPRISPDGRYVCFTSKGTDIDLNDSNFWTDIFLHDRLTGLTELVSWGEFGVSGNFHCGYNALSDDGRFIAFGSRASNLVQGDTNGIRDYFVRDRLLGSTVRINVAPDGSESNSPASHAGMPARMDISGDGRFVVFVEDATNLVPGDTNGRFDTFLRDLQLGVTERVNVSSNEEQGIYTSPFLEDSNTHPGLSYDGRYVVFSSFAVNLVPNDTNDTLDIFVRDRKAGITELVHHDSNGVQGAATSSGFGKGASVASISANGRFVAFGSESSNLVPNDTNGAHDVFFHDRMTGGPEVTLTNVIAGQTAQLSITGGSPGGIVILGASLTGQGILPTPWGPLELGGPLVFFAFALDGLGDLNNPIPLPLTLAGMPLWLQGIDLTMDFPTSVWGGAIQ